MLGIVLVASCQLVRWNAPSWSTTVLVVVTVYLSLAWRQILRNSYVGQLCSTRSILVSGYCYCNGRSVSFHVTASQRYKFQAPKKNWFLENLTPCGEPTWTPKTTFVSSSEKKTHLQVWWKRQARFHISWKEKDFFHFTTWCFSGSVGSGLNAAAHPTPVRLAGQRYAVRGRGDADTKRSGTREREDFGARSWQHQNTGTNPNFRFHGESWVLLGQFAYPSIFVTDGHEWSWHGMYCCRSGCSSFDETENMLGAEPRPRRIYRYTPLIFFDR